MKTHSIRCQCGALRGQLVCDGLSNRLVCYCTDCRAFAHFLGRAADVLDKQGGTEIVQVAQPRLSFSQGENNLAALRLSDKGMVRWYASCCNTPLGNTLATPKFGFIGLIRPALDHSRMDTDFGPAIARVNTRTALGDPPPRQRGLAGLVTRFLWIIATTRLGGRYKKSPLFDDSGSPRVRPQVLTAQELMSLKGKM